MTLTDAEDNIKKAKEWFEKIESKPVYIILTIVFSIILWIVKLSKFKFFYFINNWFLSTFNIDLINNAVYTTLLFLSTILSLLAVIKVISSSVSNFIFIHIRLPYRVKNLEPNEYNLLKYIYSCDEGIDCQTQRNIAHNLESKKLIDISPYLFGIATSEISYFPLYCSKSNLYGKYIERLLNSKKEKH